MKLQYVSFWEIIKNSKLGKNLSSAKSADISFLQLLDLPKNAIFQSSLFQTRFLHQNNKDLT